MKHSFTLPELVLVCGLVLGGALFITLRAQNANHQAECADNMRKLASAAIQYAADNNAVLPGTSAAVGVNWQMRIAPYLGYSDLKPGWRPEKFPLYKCPDDSVPPADWIRKNGHTAKLSYSANLTLIDFDGSDANCDSRKGGRAIADALHPENVILFTENHSSEFGLRYGIAVNCWNPGFTYEYTKQNGTLDNDPGKAGYHEYRNNWAMLDGSVKILQWEDTIAKTGNLWKL